jgi:8-oxo-dGTP pyrophosphatase MutT (NUDIX family)
MEKQRHQVIPRTSCLVFNQAGQLLLIKFSEAKGKMAGFYDPPGGHIEYGESIIHNATREIREETGLEVHGTTLRGVIHATNFFGKNIMLFITSSEAISTEVTGGEEGQPVWVDISDIDKLKIFDDIKHIIQLVRNSKSNSPFVANSEFDEEGRMIKWEVDA